MTIFCLSQFDGEKYRKSLAKGTDDYPRFSEAWRQSCSAWLLPYPVSRLLPCNVLFLSCLHFCLPQSLLWLSYSHLDGRSMLLWASTVIPGFLLFSFAQWTCVHYATNQHRAEIWWTRGECWGQQAAGFCLGYLWHLCPWITSSRLHYVLIFLHFPRKSLGWWLVVAFVWLDHR